MKFRIIFSFILFWTNLIFLFAQEKTSSLSSQKNIAQYVNTLDTSKLEKTKAGAQYWFADKNFANGKTIKLSIVEPGKATHAPHTHADDEFWYILEGTATFYLANDSITVPANTTLYAPSNVRHGIKNKGTSVLKYLVIREYLEQK